MLPCWRLPQLSLSLIQSDNLPPKQRHVSQSWIHSLPCTLFSIPPTNRQCDMRSQFRHELFQRGTCTSKCPCRWNRPLMMPLVLHKHLASLRTTQRTGMTSCGRVQVGLWRGPLYRRSKFRSRSKASTPLLHNLPRPVPPGTQPIRTTGSVLEAIPP